jgi:hypothetical protein
MSNYKISEVMNGKSPAFSISMSNDQVRACDYAIRSHDALTDRVAKLELSLMKIQTVVGVQSVQGACWDDEIAMEHSEAVDAVFKMATKALENKS